MAAVFGKELRPDKSRSISPTDRKEREPRAYIKVREAFLIKGGYNWS